MFWGIAGAIATSGIVGTGLAFHQISVLGERGLSVEEAAANFVPQTFAWILVAVAFGWLVDRVHPRWLLVTAMGLHAGAMLIVQAAAPGWRAVAYGLTLGASLGAVSAYQAILPRFFGLAHIGSIRGVVMSMAVGASALGPFILGFGFDRLGSYGTVLNGLLLMPLGVAILSLVARTPGDGSLTSG
jgi:MFS family permease